MIRFDLVRISSSSPQHPGNQFPGQTIEQRAPHVKHRTAHNHCFNGRVVQVAWLVRRISENSDPRIKLVQFAVRQPGQPPDH